MHRRSPVGGLRTLCGKNVSMPTDAFLLDADEKVTCKACRRIIDCADRALEAAARREEERTRALPDCSLCERPRGNGKGRCASPGDRSCKSIFGRLQVESIKKTNL